MKNKKREKKNSIFDEDFVKIHWKKAKKRDIL